MEVWLGKSPFSANRIWAQLRLIKKIVTAHSFIILRSPDLKTFEHAFHILKRRLKGELQHPHCHGWLGLCHV